MRFALNTRHGEVDFHSDNWYSRITISSLEEGFTGIAVTLMAPDLNQSDDLLRGARVRFHTPNTSPDEATEVLRVAAALAEKEREEAEHARQLKEREETLQERRDRLMNELVGETVKIRERGYKTMRPAVVSVTDWGDNEFSLRFDYTSDERTQNVERMQRLDVRVGSRWETVWDDGTDDMSVWDKELSASAKPTGRKYDGGLS